MDKEEILNFYRNYKLYIFPAIVVFSSLILILFIIYPEITNLITNQKLAGEVTSKSKFLEVKAQTLENLDSEDLNRKVGFTLGSYPTNQDFVSVLNILQNITSQSGFNTTSISLGSGSSKNSDVQYYNLKLDMLGQLNLLPVLLSNIESSPRIMRVSSFETTSGKDAQGGAIISLNIEVLYSAAPTSFGNAESPLPELSQKDEEIIAKLARSGTVVVNQQPTTTTQLGPRGKANPFE